MFSTDRWSRDVCLERVRPSSLCKWRLCQNVAIAILKTTGYHTKYVDIPVGSTLNHRTRGVNLFLRLEEASDHKDLVYALNQYFFHRGWETWATHARTTVPFTAQPTWMSGDKECDCRNCWHERPLAEPPATPAPRLTAPVATIASRLQRPDPTMSSEDEDLPPLEEILTLHPPEDLSPLEEILTLHPPEDLSPLEETLQLHATDDLVDWADLPPLEDLNASSSQASSDDPLPHRTHTPATLVLTLAEPPATPAPMLTAPPATPSIPVTTPSTLPLTKTPTTVRAERGTLRGVTRWDTRHAPPLESPVDAPTRIVHVIRGSNPRWLNATHRRDTRIVVREPPETRPYWPGRVRMPRASPNPSSHYN